MSADPRNHCLFARSGACSSFCNAVAKRATARAAGAANHARIAYNRRPLLLVRAVRFASVSRTVFPDKAEHVAGHVAHLNFFRAFGDAVAPVMAINMLELFVARITH